jgi:hypothetical protein
MAGTINFRLQHQQRGCAQRNSPPGRVKPIPLSVLKRTATSNNVASQAVSDMIILAFFFLLRLREHTIPMADNATFRLQDVLLRVGTQP